MTNLDPRAAQLLEERINEVRNTNWRPFYCQQPNCDGKPHDRWQWQHARHDQHPPKGTWDYWISLGGRGSGKTRSGSEWMHRLARNYPRLAIIAATGADLRDTVVEGNSGLLATAHPTFRPLYEPSKRRITWPNGARCSMFCVSDDTQALTPHGWVNHTQLTAGDKVWALDPDTQAGCWSEVSAVNTFGVTDEPMIHTQMRGHSSLVTLNHRWPVRPRYDRGKVVWRESIADFASRDAIITAADPEPEIYGHRKLRHTRSFAAIIGWYTSEGHLQVPPTPRKPSTKPGPGRGKPRTRRMMGSIVQDVRVNPQNVENIERVLTKEWGPALDTLQDVREPAWRRSLTSESQVVFTLNHEAMQHVWAACPGKEKVTTFEFISELTHTARERYIQAFIDGDGHRQGPSATIHQTVTARLDALEYAAILNGYGVRRPQPHILVITTSKRAGMVVPAGAHVDHRQNTTYSGIVWCPTTAHGTWLARRNGTVWYTGNSGEEPDRLRGPQHYAAWIDEGAHIPLIQEVWDNLLFGLRLGQRPQVAITSTPKPRPWLKTLVNDPRSTLTRSSTYANLDNLAPAFAQQVLSRYEGTRLGRQEIHAEILDDVEGALWTWDLIERARLTSAPTLARIVVGVDPAGSKKKSADETGIVVVGIDHDHDLYVLDDKSGHYSPHGWANAVNAAYHTWEADAIIAEANYGGEMVASNLRSSGYEGARVVVRHTRRSKALRAEPIVGRYEKDEGHVHHVGMFSELENQQTTWRPYEDTDSPDRVDALVYACTELLKASTPASISNPTQLRVVRGGAA